MRPLATADIAAMRLLVHVFIEQLWYTVRTRTLELKNTRTGDQLFDS